MRREDDIDLDLLSQVLYINMPKNLATLTKETLLQTFPHLLLAYGEASSGIKATMGQEKG